VRKVVVDVSSLRRHRHFRTLCLGQLISAGGSQLTAVAVSFQAYQMTHSSLVVGLVSTAQLVPVLIGSIWGGGIADAKDRRKVLIAAQLVMAATSAGLALNAALGHPQLWPLFVLTAASAAFSGADSPARKAALPMLVPPADLTGALALQSMLIQWAFVAGPALAGLAIATLGLSGTYLIDVASYCLSILTVLRLPSLVPVGGGTPMSLKSIKEGLGYLKGQRLLTSSFAIDIDAMVFGMPRAVFPALGLALYGGGAATVGLLYAAPSAGALIGSFFTGWVSSIRHQGRAVVLCVIAWGTSIAVFGLVPVLWVGLALLALAGAADLISAVFRTAILQSTVPEDLQGRLSGVFFAVVTGGPRLGDAETGGASALGGAQFAVWSGGLACVVGAALLAWRIPELWRQETPGPTSGSAQTQILAIDSAVAALAEAEPA